jgi:hypothetical protein
MTITTNDSPETFTLQLSSQGSFNCNVDWGEGSEEVITAYDDEHISHEYATAGTYTVKVRGIFLGMVWNNGGDKLNVDEIQQWGCLTNLPAVGVVRYGMVRVCKYDKYSNGPV